MFISFPSKEFKEILGKEDWEFTVIEKTGHKEETQELFDKLKPFGILEFVRSGRVAIARPMPNLHSWLEEVGLTDKFLVNPKK